MPRSKPLQPENLSVAEELKKEQASELHHAQQIQPQTSVITKPQSPAVQVTSAAISTTTASLAATTAIPQTTSAIPSKLTSLKAHVLNASKLANPVQQQQQQQQQQQVVITKPPTATASMAGQSPSVVQPSNLVKPTQPAVVQALHLQVSSNRVASPSLSPRTKQTVAQIAAANGGKGQGQPMSPVLNNTGAPPNPKQHLLQAAKQQTSTIMNLPQKLAMNVQPASVTAAPPTPRIHQPVASQPTALKAINGQPHPLNPKAHLLQAVVPPMVVASPPTQSHLMNPQPGSVSCSRPPAPKPSLVNIFFPFFLLSPRWCTRLDRIF